MITIKNKILAIKKLQHLIVLQVVLFGNISISDANEYNDNWDQILHQTFSEQQFPSPAEDASILVFTSTIHQPYVTDLGETLLIKILIPPGASKVNISAQSNAWQCAPDILDSDGNILVSTWDRCPRMDGFDYYPGEICQRYSSSENPQPCGEGNYIYPDDLHLVSARLSDVVFPTRTESAVALEPQYAYFTLFQPVNAEAYFTPSSAYGIGYGITDVEAYRAWRNNRPWAGGPIENSEDGVDESNPVTPTTIPTTIPTTTPTATPTATYIATPTITPLPSPVVTPTPFPSQSPTAIIQSSSTIESAPATFYLDGTQSYAGIDHELVFYEWQLNGEVVSNAQWIILDLENPGNYQISLSVEDENGGFDTATQILTLQDAAIDTNNNAPNPEENNANTDDENASGAGSLALLQIFALLLLLIGHKIYRTYHDDDNTQT